MDKGAAMVWRVLWKNRSSWAIARIVGIRRRYVVCIPWGGCDDV